MTEVKQRSVVLTGYNGISIAADIYGEQNQPAIIFAHGGGQTRHAWRHSGKLLAAAGFQSICVDLRGHATVSGAQKATIESKPLLKISCACVASLLLRRSLLVLHSEA